MSRIGAGTNKKSCPGRCERCGRLMVMVRLQDRLEEGGPRHLMGWRCLICGKVVDLHSLGHRHELLEREASRRCPLQEWRGRMAQYG